MLQGLKIAVTGATAGIGAATASLCAARGASVIVTGRNADRGSAVCREILKNGGLAAFCLSDVTANDSGETTVVAALTHFGRLDALVNNAGILAGGDALSCTDAEWDLVMTTNATAVFRHSRAAERQMQRQGTGGAIVNIASDWGLAAPWGRWPMPPVKAPSSN